MIKSFFTFFRVGSLFKIKKTLKQGLWYTYISICIVCLSAILFLGGRFETMGGITRLEQLVKTFIYTEYRNDLIVTVSKEGVLSKNIIGPVFLFDRFLEKEQKNRNAERGDSLKEKVFEHIVTIDDTKSADVSALENAKSLFFIGKNGMVAQKNNGTIEVTQFSSMAAASDFKGFSITQEKLLLGVDQLFPYLRPFFIISGIVLLVCAPLFFMIGHLLWTFVVALLVMLLSKLKKSISYKEAYLLSLYAGVPAILLGSAIKPFVSVIAVQTLLTVIFFLVALYTEKEKKA